MNKVTYQYWIYMNGIEVQRYFDLIRDVIAPLDLVNCPHFHFFRYCDDKDHYIRLRVISSDIKHVNIKKSLKDAISKGQIKSFEKKEYDLQEDISVRFGIDKTAEICHLINTSSKLALLYATSNQVYDPNPNKWGGVAGIVHLVSNTLNYNVILEHDKIYTIEDWNRTDTRKGNICP